MTAFPRSKPQCVNVFCLQRSPAAGFVQFLCPCKGNWLQCSEKGRGCAADQSAIPKAQIGAISSGKFCLPRFMLCRATASSSQTSAAPSQTFSFSPAMALLTQEIDSQFPSDFFFSERCHLRSGSVILRRFYQFLFAEWSRLELCYVHYYFGASCDSSLPLHSLQIASGHLLTFIPRHKPSAEDLENHLCCWKMTGFGSWPSLSRISWQKWDWERNDSFFHHTEPP